MNNFILRSLTAIILAPAIIAIIYIGGQLFNFLMIMATVIMAYEWNVITSSSVNRPLSKFASAKEIKGETERKTAVYKDVHEDLSTESTHNLPAEVEFRKRSKKNTWYFLGILYISLPISSLIWLRSIDYGVFIIFWLFSIVWATDIGAYIFGRLIGGPKLAPKISPNKTWSGLIGGVLCAGITGYIYSNIRNLESYYIITCFSMMLAVYAQIGDLIESFIKRKFGVKDSGDIIPGHGGLLDRVDGIITTAPKVALIVILQNGNIFW